MYIVALSISKPVSRAFGAEDVRIMLIEMVTRLAKLQIVAHPTPGNPIERQRSPALPQNCIRAKLHSRKSIRLLFVENILSDEMCEENVLLAITAVYTLFNRRYVVN